MAPGSSPGAGVLFLTARFYRLVAKVARNFCEFAYLGNHMVWSKILWWTRQTYTLKMLKLNYLDEISFRTLSFGEIMPISKIEGQFWPFDVLQVHDWLFRKCTRSLLPVHDWKFRRTYEVSTDLEIMAASLQKCLRNTCDIVSLPFCITATSVPYLVYLCSSSQS